MASSGVSTRPPWPSIVGPDDFGGAFVDVIGGQVNLDYAATTPALRSAVEAVLRLLPAYGSVHRGGGARSRVTTEAYEAAREALARFLGCASDHLVVFVRNTTEGINLVAASLPDDARILCSPLEHHANLLPWRDRHVALLPFTSSATGFLQAAVEALEREARAGRPFDLLSVSGASNVTGEVLPLAELIAAAHATGTHVLVDAAQLAPHRRLDLGSLEADYLAISGHKLYAPFGAGVIVARRNLLEDAPPFLKGGGAVRLVTLDDVAWADLPQRFEAGTPNVVGAVALAAACDELRAYGMDALEAREGELATRLWQGLERLPSCRLLRGWLDGVDRMPVASFTLDGHESRHLAERLCLEHGVAVRSGLLCAHPFVCHLLGTSRDSLVAARADRDVVLPGAVRASVGIGVEPEDVDRLVAGLGLIAGEPVRSRPQGA